MRQMSPRYILPHSVWVNLSFTNHGSMSGDRSIRPRVGSACRRWTGDGLAVHDPGVELQYVTLIFPDQLQCALGTIGTKQIVAVDEYQKFAAAFAHPAFSGQRLAQILPVGENAYTRIVRCEIAKYLRTFVGGAVVDTDYFHIPKRLVADGAHRLRQILFGIVYGDDDRDSGIAAHR